MPRQVVSAARWALQCLAMVALFFARLRRSRIVVYLLEWVRAPWMSFRRAAGAAIVWAVPENLLHQQRQAIKARAHVSVTSRQPHPHAARGTGITRP